MIKNKKLLKEADNYQSITKDQQNTFDPSNINTNIFADENEEDSTVTDNEKQSLIDQAVEKIQQNLTNSKELQDILQQINKLKKEANDIDWEINEAGNTATLGNKNARIFKQNNNICLSYNNKIEIFKTVQELHNWLRKNNMPLPKNIKLHESSPWDNILKGITTNDGYKIGDQVPFSQEDLEKRQEKMQKPMVKMGRAQYKDAMKFLDKKKEKLQNPIKGLSPEELSETQFDDKNLWYLSYKTSNSNTNFYLNNDWKDGNLLADNLDQAAKFLNKDEAIAELEEVYKNKIINAPFIPEQVSDIEECFGTTTANVGTAVQYTGDKDLNEADLEEGVYGYPGTPFEKKYYDRKYARASDYLKWYNSLNDNEQRNVDPNEENYDLARKEMADYQGRDLGAKHWSSKYISAKDPDQMFRGMFDFRNGTILDKEALIQRIKEINEKYGLDINPDEPVITLSNSPEEYKISKHNKEQRDKWISDYYIPNRMLNQTRGYIQKNAQKRKDDYEQELLKKSQEEQDPSKQKVLKAYNSLLDQRNNPTIDIPDEQFFDLISKELAKLNQDEQNDLLSRLVKAGEEGEVDINDFFLHILKSKITDKKESILTTPMETTLTEDDKPEDFADPTSVPSTNNVPNQSEINNQTSNDINSNKGDFFDPTDSDYTNDIDSLGGSESDAPATDFGGISANGSFTPNEDEDFNTNFEMEPEYQVVDVLVNENNPADIQVKLKNTETGEIEIKNLNEVNI